jgi:hypothetical protein
MVYTILTAFLCMLICLTIFSFELYKRRDTLSYMQYITHLSSDEESKEFILTDVNFALIQNVNPINKTEMASYLVLNNNSIFFKHNRDFSTYDNEKKLLVISCYFDNYYHKEYYYSIDVSDNKFIYISLGEIIALGGI